MEAGRKRWSLPGASLALACGVAWMVACGSGEEAPAPAPAPAPSAVEREVIPPAPAPGGADAAPQAARQPAMSEEEDVYYDDYDDEEFAEIMVGLRSDDPDDRADAVLDLEPEGRSLPYLLEIVSDDPDPEVRITAVGQLEDGESPEAIAGLVAALNDPDSEVVLEAIDALEFAADYQVIGSLQQLNQHPDPEVREAASDAIEYLEE